MTPETIVLPRSGLVLTVISRYSAGAPFLWGGPASARMGRSGAYWVASIGGESAPHGLAQTKGDDGIWRVHADGFERVRDWLDSRVLALRAALLDGEGVREKVARAYIAAEKSRGRDCNCDHGPCSACMTFENTVADAVLAALRDGGGK